MTSVENNKNIEVINYLEYENSFGFFSVLGQLSEEKNWFCYISCPISTYNIYFFLLYTQEKRTIRVFTEEVRPKIYNLQSILKGMISQRSWDFTLQTDSLLSSLTCCGQRDCWIKTSKTKPSKAWWLFWFWLYYTHFEITRGPCDLIGSNWCDLFANCTIFCFKLHLFPSQ